ncbi:MAG: hypothetical protein OHK0022_35270 [Roseiflexaceae bacterium]
MRNHMFAVLVVAGLLLSSCGVADQTSIDAAVAPTSIAAYPLGAEASQSASPVPASVAYEQTALAFQTEAAVWIEHDNQTARALGPLPTLPPEPSDLGPTEVPASQEKLPGGGYLMHDVGLYIKHPVYNNGWSLDLPDGRQMWVVAGGYIFAIDNPFVEVIKPEHGALAVMVFLHQGHRILMPKVDKSDPRNREVTLPVQDGMAQVVDALVTADRITVMLRTEGGSAYTYEVNSGTLAVAQPPSADAGGPYRVRAGEFVGLQAQGSDPAGTRFDYAWDLDGDGSFETKGQQVGFSAKDLAAPQQRTVRVQVTAKNGLSSVAETTISIDN